jgi:hypothetical protein
MSRFCIKIAAVVISLSLVSASVMLFAGSVSFTYDQWGRIVKAAYDNGKSVTYTYDQAGNIVSRQTSPVSAGDVYPDNALTLKDAIVALQVAAGAKPPSVAAGADVNQNNVISVEEAVFVLQKVAGKLP